MKQLYTLLLLVCVIALPVSAQKLELKTDSTVTTKHTVTINGKRIPYTATAGTQPVWDEDGKPVAGLFYTYYERSDVKDKASRPLVVSFNGGPGSASVWMHIAYTGPRILNIDDEGYPLQPYGIKENPHSILDVADIVFVNPVNTGLSRAVPTLSKEDAQKKFFGINADIKYLASWINTFVGRKGRWDSPKYLIGESYGTTRVSGLALELQNAHWMYLNGVILVSPTELGIKRDGPVASANILPYYAATAWFHNKLSPELQSKDLTAMLPEVEEFTINELIPAIAKGWSLGELQKKAVAARMAKYSGLSEEVILQHNLDVPAAFFWKELLRDEGFTVGRLDSRYIGIDKQDAGLRPDYAPELTSWLHSFTPAINLYIKDHLKYKTDIKYNMFGPVRPWDNSDDNTGDNLRQAMAQNPNLHLMVQSGYYDGACDYFNAKYNMWQMDPGGKLQDRMRFKGYRSGHMMYLRAEDLANANQDIRQFILESVPKPGQPAKYKRDGAKDRATTRAN
ncbi:S10 family peptidase [Pontibacter akesuensis]|uniref:Carboxypeptidase C (Cathepsin A) n=1 Tax=Pontibacter akesuensis TaxID=388950 RepID=A0A1I7J2Q9_9BACT|nr:carboxypeptidase [Pontibacter akesuensis]GHA72758.1 carboxypeptidase [Pontibacter akesuensis]SFU79437.1 Carboxypeptidase C (cathepsin A) [Pontibacter akesuensis]